MWCSGSLSEHLASAKFRVSWWWFWFCEHPCPNMPLQHRQTHGCWGKLDGSALRGCTQWVPSSAPGEARRLGAGGLHPMVRPLQCQGKLEGPWWGAAPGGCAPDAGGPSRAQCQEAAPGGCPPVPVEAWGLGTEGLHPAGPLQYQGKLEGSAPRGCTQRVPSNAHASTGAAGPSVLGTTGAKGDELQAWKEKCWKRSLCGGCHCQGWSGASSHSTDFLPLLGTGLGGRLMRTEDKLFFPHLGWLIFREVFTTAWK